jgi:hypothetical protein
LALAHWAVINDPEKRSVRVRRSSSTGRSAIYGRTKVASDDQNGMMRGLVHGLILSLAIWVVAGYLTFILR